MDEQLVIRSKIDKLLKIMGMHHLELDDYSEVRQTLYNAIDILSEIKKDKLAHDLSDYIQDVIRPEIESLNDEKNEYFKDARDFAQTIYLYDKCFNSGLTKYEFEQVCKFFDGEFDKREIDNKIELLISIIKDNDLNVSFED